MTTEAPSAVSAEASPQSVMDAVPTVLARRLPTGAGSGGATAPSDGAPAGLDGAAPAGPDGAAPARLDGAESVDLDGAAPAGPDGAAPAGLDGAAFAALDGAAPAGPDGAPAGPDGAPAGLNGMAPAGGPAAQAATPPPPPVAYADGHRPDPDAAVLSADADRPDAGSALSADGDRFDAATAVLLDADGRDIEAVTPDAATAVLPADLDGAAPGADGPAPVEIDAQYQPDPASADPAVSTPVGAHLVEGQVEGDGLPAGTPAGKDAGLLADDVVASAVADQLGAVVGDDVEADPAEFAAAAVLDVLRASGWADAAEAAELRAETERLRELLNMVIRDHRAREASAAGVENQQLHWLVPLLRSAHGVAFGTLGAKVALRTAVQDVPPEVLASAGLRIDYGIEPVYEEDPTRP